MNKITIYSTTTCPYCKQLKDYLTSKGVTFVEKLVDMDESAQKEMSAISNGFLGVPFTTITDESGNTQTVLGFDVGKLNSVLKINTNEHQ